jgi:ubiquinone/menaquinone biosynthesis C-methylase UbiE
MQMDSECLAFADASFDWVVVRDGLHHLARPLKGLYEIERVCREGFAIVEGQDSLLVRVLVKLGLGEDWDPAGGYTYRFSRRELYKVFASVQTISKWQVFTTWLPPGSDAVRHFPSVMQFVNPAVNHRFVHPLLSAKTGQYLMKTVFRAVHLMAGHWGNSLIAVAHKK